SEGPILTRAICKAAGVDLSFFQYPTFSGRDHASRTAVAQQPPARAAAGRGPAPGRRAEQAGPAPAPRPARRLATVTQDAADRPGPAGRTVAARAGGRIPRPGSVCHGVIHARHPGLL